MDRADAIGLAQLAAIIGLCFEVLAVSVGGVWPDPGIPLVMSVSFIAGAGAGALIFGALLWAGVRTSDRDTMIVDGNLKKEKVKLGIEVHTKEAIEQTKDLRSAAWEPFVFLDDCDIPYLVNEFGDDLDIWLHYLHPDGQWVTLRKLAWDEVLNMRERALPIEQAKLYGSAWIWEKREEPNEGIKEMRDRHFKSLSFFSCRIYQ